MSIKEAKRTGRPPGKSGVVRFPKLIGVGLTEEMHAELKEVAASEYRTLAAQVRFFVSQGLKGGQHGSISRLE